MLRLCLQNDRDDLDYGRDTIGAHRRPTSSRSPRSPNRRVPIRRCTSSRAAAAAPYESRSLTSSTGSARSDPEHDQPRRAQALKDSGGDPWEAQRLLCTPEWHDTYRDRFPRRDAPDRHHPSRHAAAATAGRARRTTATEALEAPVARRSRRLHARRAAGGAARRRRQPAMLRSPGSGQHARRAAGPSRLACTPSRCACSPARWYRVGATMYGGPTDPTSGDYGSIGIPGQSYLPAHPDSFAELSVLDHNPANGGSFTFADANALNNLPYLTGLRVANNGVQKILYKRDVGYGQGPGQLIANGQPYRLDVWWQSAGPLGVSKNPVDIQLAPATGAGATLGQLPASTQAPGASTIDPGCAAAISGQRDPAAARPRHPDEDPAVRARRRRPVRAGRGQGDGRRRQPPVRQAVHLGWRTRPVARHHPAGIRLLKRRLLRAARRRRPRPERARLRRARQLGAPRARALRDRLRQQRPRVHVRRRAAVRHLLQRHRHRTRTPASPARAGASTPPSPAGPPGRSATPQASDDAASARASRPARSQPLTAIVALGGCGISDPYSHASTTTTLAATRRPPAPDRPTAQNTGEPPAPPPPTAAEPGAERARSDAGTGDPAVRAALRQLDVADAPDTSARSSPRSASAPPVSPSNRPPPQPAATARSPATHVYNRGQIVSIAPSRTQPGEWVIVTREQTGGNAQYDGLQPSWHVTLAELAHLPNGYWTVSRMAAAELSRNRGQSDDCARRASPPGARCQPASTRVASAPPRRACGCSPPSASCWRGSRPGSRRAPIRTRRCTERSASSRA